MQLTKPRVLRGDNSNMPTTTTRTENITQSSLDYEKFVALPGNRDINQSHVKRLAAALAEHPEIAEAQPILVNEKFQIIDGQHRFEAEKLLNLPVYYSVVPGIGIETARYLNVMQKQWRPRDYAKSYAVTGNENYKIYLEAVDDFGLPHVVILRALGNYYSGEDRGRLGYDFKEGRFVVKNKDEAYEHMAHINELATIMKIPPISPLCHALLKVFSTPDFSYERLLEKLRMGGQSYVQAYSNVRDYMRMLDDIYNYRSPSRTRLY